MSRKTTTKTLPDTQIGEQMNEKALLDMAKSDEIFQVILGFEKFLQTVTADVDADMERWEITLRDIASPGTLAGKDLTRYGAAAGTKACMWAQAGFVLGLCAARNPFLMLEAAGIGKSMM